MTLLEICVDTAEGLDAALAGGADRIELCSALELGGLTPSPGLLALAAERKATARAMIRPRGGDFVFTPADVAMMRAEIDAARRAGIEGVVLGANLPDGRLDVNLLRELVEESAGLKRTLHRAFDLVPNLDEALEQAVTLGFDTILTAGRSPSASAGLDDIVRAHELAAGRLVVMAGAGVSAETIDGILARVRLGAVHGSCSSPAEPDSDAAARLGFTSALRRQTDQAKVERLKSRLSRSLSN